MQKMSMKRRTILPALLLLVLMAGLLSACAGLRKSQRMSEFQDTASLYQNAIRWNNFKEALGFLQHPAEALNQQRLNRLALLRVTDYEMGSERFSDDGRSVDVSAVIEYVWLDQMVQRRIIDHQHWVYVQKLKRWQLDGDLPQFK
jgi:hypothetical protein